MQPEYTTPSPGHIEHLFYQSCLTRGIFRQFVYTISAYPEQLIHHTISPQSPQFSHHNYHSNFIVTASQQSFHPLPFTYHISSILIHSTTHIHPFTIRIIYIRPTLTHPLYISPIYNPILIPQSPTTPVIILTIRFIYIYPYFPLLFTLHNITSMHLSLSLISNPRPLLHHS